MSSSFFIVILIFQMIQAIQVLRFHLLELEKVIFSVRCATSDLWAVFAKMYFCQSVIISVKINHGAISLPRLITTQAVTTGTDICVPKSPRVF